MIAEDEALLRHGLTHLLEAAQRIADGWPEVAIVVLSQYVQRRADQLTARQREVLVLLAEGRANLAIAQELSITEKSVVAHVSHIYDALGSAATAHDHRRVLVDSAASRRLGPRSGRGYSRRI